MESQEELYVHLYFDLFIHLIKVISMSLASSLVQGLTSKDSSLPQLIEIEIKIEIAFIKVTGAHNT